MAKKRQIGGFFLLVFLMLPKLAYALGEGVDFLDLLENTWVLALLVILGMAGLVVELFTPGFSFGGLVAGLSFILFFTGSIGNEISSFLSLFVFILGILLLMIEVLIPGFGLPGIAGLVAMVGGLVMASPSLSAAAFTLAVALLISGALFFFFVKNGYQSQYIRRIILANKTMTPPGQGREEDLQVQEGMEGSSLSPLRPSGFIDIDGQRIDAMTEGDFIEGRRPVVVTRVLGKLVYVKERQD
ncbi:MAG: hypothetical protein Q4E37_02135 [Tissierellia bacterium]|nr:hypothetical protein [Tissierellia bacterium]